MASRWNVIESLQRKILFPREYTRADPRAGEGIDGLERIWIDSADGKVEAWVIPGRGAGPEAPAPAVLFAHGNGELIDHWPEALARYREWGITLMLCEYRGYGRSAGSPSERAIAEDFLAFHQRLASRRDVDQDRIVLHGRSLGGGAVAALAAARRPAAMILQSTFLSVTRLARRFLLPARLVADPFDTESVVRRLDVPILVMHGTRDAVVPFDHGRALAAAAPRARLVSYDAGHNDCPTDWERYWADLRAFLGEASILRA